MKYEPIKRVPLQMRASASTRKKVFAMVDAFMEDDAAHTARIIWDFDEYSSVTSAYYALLDVMAIGNYPIKLFQREGLLYMTKVPR